MYHTVCTGSFPGTEDKGNTGRGMVWNVKLSVTRGPRENYKINALIPKGPKRSEDVIPITK